MSKKPLAIILAFFIVFAPVYANAVLLPLLAVAASSTGRVLVGNAIKRVGQAAISRAGMASMAAGLGYMGSTKSAIEQDGWTIDYGSGGSGAGGSWDSPGKGVDSEGNIDVSIYKLDKNEECLGNAVFPVYRNYPATSYVITKDPMSALNRSTLLYIESQKPFGRTYVFKGNYDMSNFNAAISENVAYVANIPPNSQDTNKTVWRKTVAVPGDFLYVEKNSTIRESSYVQYGYTFLPCEDATTSNKIYITNNEFNAYLTKNITNNQAGDLIKNIYNYDYSQHPNITINNNTTGGNSLNNDLSLNVDPNADIKVSPRLRLDIESNKVNLDNVNDENCTKNEAGEYDNCTGEPDPEEEETDPDDPNNPSPEEPPPIECSANGFYKKICDWMDWTKKEHTEPTDTNVDVTDKTSEIVIDDSRISFDDQCPTPKDINITVSGHSFSDALDYQPICDFFTKLKPFVVGILGAFPSAMIIAGGARRG